MFFFSSFFYNVFKQCVTMEFFLIPKDQTQIAKMRKNIIINLPRIHWIIYNIQ